MNRELKEFRRLERVCLEQAELSTLDLARIGLLKVADDCRLAAEAIETRSTLQPGALAGVVHALKMSLSSARGLSRH
jgi:hypothetical protein